MTESNPRQNVTFASNGGQAHGYLAKPASGSGPGVVVIQEWWGLDDHIADIADRLAAEGFVALAPDLFGGKVAHDTDERRQVHAGAAGRAGREATSPARSTSCSPTTTSPRQGRRGRVLHGRRLRAAARRAAGRQDRRGGAVLRRRPGRAGRLLGDHRTDPGSLRARRTTSTRSTRRASRSRRSASSPVPTSSSSTTRPGTRSTTTRTRSAPTTPTWPSRRGHARSSSCTPT